MSILVEAAARANGRSQIEEVPHDVGVLCESLFFFQAEDGIRDLTVTGVQTCALPIFRHHILLAKVAQRVNDPDVLHGLKLMLKASGTKGVAQGGVLSPLLSNLYLTAVEDRKSVV